MVIWVFVIKIVIYFLELINGIYYEFFWLVGDMMEKGFNGFSKLMNGWYYKLSCWFYIDKEVEFGFFMIVLKVILSFEWI